MRKTYPEIFFQINELFDIRCCASQVNGLNGLCDFILKILLPENIHYILTKEMSNTDRHEVIHKYASEFYQSNESEIKLGFERAKEEWFSKKDCFFTLTERIFKGMQWPKGEYIGSLSIFGVFPRNVETREFLFPYKNAELASAIIAHEMIHFIFSYFVKKKYGLSEFSKIKGKSRWHIWRVSEAFNAALEVWDPYCQMFKKEPRVFPGVEDIFEEILRDWKEREDIDKLLDKWLK
jgi:hypothetical protein